MKNVFFTSKFIILFFFLTTLKVTSQQITGYVYHKNKPISNVKISVKNTSKITVSDENGKFTLKVKKSDIIIFTHLSMQTKEIKVKNFNTLKIQLDDKINSLDEVKITSSKRRSKGVFKPEIIHTAFGKINPKTAGFTIHSISGEMIKNSGAELTRALIGRIPNYRLTKDGVLLRLRGFSNNSYAIWDIDGMVFDKFPPYIDPETIESINVIPNAAGIVAYGTRGRGGVIVVNTKKYNKSLKSEIKYLQLKRITHDNSQFPEEEKELVALIKNKKFSIKNLTAMALYCKQKGYLKLALKINSIILAREPNNMKHYRNYATSLIDTNNENKAWSIYKTFLSKKIKSLEKTKFDIIFHDMERLYHPFKMKQIIGDKFQSRKKTANHYTNETRLVFEWTDSAIKDMEVEIINPKKEVISLQLGSNSNSNTLIDELFIDNKIKGNWKLNISFPEDEQLTGNLKVTVYKNWISSTKKPETTTYSLSKLRRSKYKLMDLKI